MPSKIDFSNDRQQLVGRLLELLPFNIVKSEYDLKGSAGKVHSKIAKDVPWPDIKEDFLRLFGYCRQHIYLFEHSESNISSINPEFFSERIEHESIFEQKNDSLVKEYLLELNYDFLSINNRTADEKQMKYLWPIRIEMTRSILIVRLVIMEKNKKSTDECLFKGRDLDDDTIIEQVLSAVPSSSLAHRLDINRGIKSIWKDDTVDAHIVSYKSKSSTDNSYMDSELTYKATYPDRYEEIINNSLHKTSFSILDNDSLPARFTVLPQDGTISFQRYQKNPDAIMRLIGEIIQRN